MVTTTKRFIHEFENIKNSKENIVTSLSFGAFTVLCDSIKKIDKHLCFYTKDNPSSSVMTSLVDCDTLDRLYDFKINLYMKTTETKYYNVKFIEKSNIKGEKI